MFSRPCHLFVKNPTSLLAFHFMFKSRNLILYLIEDKLDKKKNNSYEKNCATKTPLIQTWYMFAWSQQNKNWLKLSFSPSTGFICDTSSFLCDLHLIFLWICFMQSDGEHNADTWSGVISLIFRLGTSRTVFP